MPDVEIMSESNLVNKSNLNPNQDSTHIVDHLSVFLCAVISAPNDDPQNVKAVSFCKVRSSQYSDINNNITIFIIL